MAAMAAAASFAFVPVNTPVAHAGPCHVSSEPSGDLAACKACVDLFAPKGTAEQNCYAAGPVAPIPSYDPCYSTGLNSKGQECDYNPGG